MFNFVAMITKRRDFKILDANE